VWILFDQGTPVPLRRCLNGHVVATAYELGWSTVTNGDLIRLAEQEGYELLTTTSWPRIRPVTSIIQAVTAAIGAGDYQGLPIP
jgi:hypothetical protein